MQTIRRMDKGDVEAVAGIENQSPSPWSREQIAAELKREDSIVLVVQNRAERELFGWCCARVVGDDAELLKIAVRSDCRQAGCGHRLLSELCLNLCSQKVEAVFLEVRSQNRAAISLYRRNAFEQVGVRANYYKNPNDNALIFRKDLLYSRR